MTPTPLQNPVVRRVLRSVVFWLLAQAVLVVAGRLASRRFDQGDETSTEIRRVLVMTGEELRPTNPALSRVRVEAVMGGVQLDLTSLAPPPEGIDVTARSLMGGVAIRVPTGWRTWWSFRGVMGGIGADTGVDRVTDPAAADLRVYARAVMGGVGIETPKV